MLIDAVCWMRRLQVALLATRCHHALLNVAKSLLNGEAKCGCLLHQLKHALLSLVGKCHDRLLASWTLSAKIVDEPLDKVNHHAKEVVFRGTQ